MGLDTVELVLRIEEHFGIEISNEDAEMIVTVRDLVDCVCKVSRKQAKLLDEGKVFEAIEQILRDEFVGRKTRIELTSRIVDDLRLD